MGREPVNYKTCKLLQNPCKLLNLTVHWSSCSSWERSACSPWGMRNCSDLNVCTLCFAGLGAGGSVCVQVKLPKHQFSLTVLWVLCFGKYCDKTSLKKGIGLKLLPFLIYLEKNIVSDQEVLDIVVSHCWIQDWFRQMLMIVF